MRTLCIYATHEPSYNLDFFIQHGIYRSESDIDYYIVLNDPGMKLEVPGVKVVNRENLNADFGAWSSVLLENERYKEYDYFVLLNSTVRGPFLPVWQKDRNWLKSFTDQITDQKKLIGITIGWYGFPPHVQSMLLAFDRVGMEIAINENIFSLNPEKQSYKQLIANREVRLSQCILDAGYNIGCLLKAFEGVDFRQDRRNRDSGVFWRSSYYGLDVHPYETIFVKTKEYVGFCESNPYIDHVTVSTDLGRSLDYNAFDWRAYLIQHDDLWDAGLRTEKDANEHYNEYGRGGGRMIHSVSQVGKFLTINSDSDLISAIIIGHYTGRNISLNNPSLDYPRVNLLIASLNLSTRIGTNGHCYGSRPYASLDQDAPLEYLKALRRENYHALDLGSKFPSMKGIELYPKLAVGLQSQSDLFTVWSAEVAYGVLGLDGSLGYSSEKIQVPGEGYITLSAHAPSRITLTLKKPVMVSGYCSPTSMNPPELHFINFGKTTQSGEQTLARRLEPGTHTLSVETSSMVCAHSVWLLKIQTE